LKTAEAIELYENLEEACHNIESFADFRKVAEILDHTERSEGCYNTNKVANELMDPVDRIFTMPVEKVASMLNLVEMGGSQFPMEDLQKVAAGVYKEAFGIDIDPSDARALGDVLPTMPRMDVAFFEELSGVKPL
jgi:hypothetical protein